VEWENLSPGKASDIDRQGRFLSERKAPQLKGTGWKKNTPEILGQSRHGNENKKGKVDSREEAKGEREGPLQAK